MLEGVSRNVLSDILAYGGEPSKNKLPEVMGRAVKKCEPTMDGLLNKTF